MDEFGNETGHVPKHFMIGSASKSDTRMAELKDCEEVEHYYRLWSGNKVNEDDIKAINALPVNPAGIKIPYNYILKIGNLASRTEIEYEYGKMEDEPKPSFMLFRMQYETLFYSKTVITNTPELALRSYNNRVNEANSESSKAPSHPTAPTS